MKAGFVIEGAAELEAKLRTLGGAIERRVVRIAVRAARKPLLMAARSNARSIVGGTMGGQLARALVIVTPKKQRKGSYSMHVQFLSTGRDVKRKHQIGVAGFTYTSKSGKESYIPSAIEYGHGASKERSARPFLRPAADSTRDETERILSKELASGILREAIKARYK